jgi:hypothetical protein
MDAEDGRVTEMLDAWSIADEEVVRDVRALLNLYNELGNFFDAMDRFSKIQLPADEPRSHVP